MSEYIEKFEQWLSLQSFDQEPLDRAIDVFSELNHPDSPAYISSILREEFMIEEGMLFDGNPVDYGCST